MPAHIKVLRLLGAVLVTLALVPWLGASPAAATGGGSKGSPAPKGQDEEPGSAAKPHGPPDDDKPRADKAEAKLQGKPDEKPSGKAKSRDARSGTGAGSSTSTGTQKVTMCHRTNADSNPYVRITVSINSVIKGSGHGGHQGPAYASGMKAAKQKWGDIIPAFSYPGGSYAGTNWPAGRAVFDGGCTTPSGGGQTTPPTTSTPDGGGNQKVTLCHRTNAETNPYVRITVSISSVVKGAGHDGHNGPLFVAGMKSAKQKWGDIIPSFTYAVAGGTTTYGGKNWPAGRAIFDAGCAVSLPDSTASASVTPTTSTSVSPSSDTSVSPSGDETVTTTATGNPTADTSVQPTKIGGGDDGTGVLGGRTGVLPRTGLTLPFAAVLGLSLALLLAGGSLLLAPSRIADRARRH